VESRFLLEPLTAEFERALKPRVDAIVRKWVDINQNQGIRKLTVLNDSDYAWPEPDKIILKRFSQVFLWSDKEQLASAMRTQG
jgi:hypothetical protein